MSVAITPGQYLKHCRLAANMTRLDVALRTETSPPVSALQRAALIALIEADLVPVRITTAITLASIPDLRVSLPVLAQIADAFEDHVSRTPSFRISPASTLAEKQAG